MSAMKWHFRQTDVFSSRLGLAGGQVAPYAVGNQAPEPLLHQALIKAKMIKLIERALATFPTRILDQARHLYR